MKPEDRTPESIRTALDDLTHSEGWTILKELVEAQFGSAAQLQEIDAAMKALDAADSLGQIAIVTQIRARQQGAYAVMDLPTSKLRAVQPETQPASAFHRAKTLLRGA
jgi:hypothetical protein